MQIILVFSHPSINRAFKRFALLAHLKTRNYYFFERREKIIGRIGFFFSSFQNFKDRRKGKGRGVQGVFGEFAYMYVCAYVYVCMYKYVRMHSNQPVSQARQGGKVVIVIIM